MELLDVIACAGPSGMPTGFWVAPLTDFNRNFEKPDDDHIGRNM
jgi:hypothetical protein